MKGKIALQSNLIFVFIVYNAGCASTDYKKIATEHPYRMIEMQESLLKGRTTKEIKTALITSHNKVGILALNNKEYKKAVDHFSNALQLSENDTLSKYNLFIAEGHRLFQTGNKDKLWNAIRLYYKAAQLQPELGDPHYYIGQSYHKIGDTEFDLILESYKTALDLKLTDKKRREIKSEYSLALDREKKLKNFWK